jgi:hypothetical protein
LQRQPAARSGRARRGLADWGRLGLLGRAHRRLGVARRLRLDRLFARQVHDPRGDDLYALAISAAVFRRIFAPVESPLHQDPAPFLQVLRVIFGLFAEGGHREEVGLVDPVIAFFAAAVDADPDVGDQGAAWGLPRFDVAGQVAGDHYVVHVLVKHLRLL